MLWRPHFQSVNHETVRMFFLMKSQTSFKMGHVLSETRSLGQMVDKPYVCSRGYIFSLIIMKLDQLVCVD